MTKAYKYAVFYFLCFSLLLIISGGMLFEEKLGFSIESISEYYIGNNDKFIPSKSASGILKIILPHIFAFGLFSMVILHFLVFTKQRDSLKAKLLIYLTFTTAFLEMFSPFFIIYGGEFFGFLKLLSFILFEGLVVYIAWLLFHSIVYD